MLLRLTSFELKFHFKQTSYLLFTILFFLGGIFFASQEGAIKPQNKYNIHLFTSLISLGAVFQIVFQVVYTVLRDYSNQTTQLIHTTAVKKFEFLLSRFLGIFITSAFSTFLYALALYSCIKGNFFGIYSNSGSSEFISYLWPWLIIILPNVFVLTGLLFTIALLTKKTPYVFFMGVFIFAFFWINNFYIGSPFTGGRLVAPQETLSKVAVIDILGLCSSYEQTQFWTPLEKESQLVSFSGNMLLNRMLWFSISLLSLLIGYFSFSFRLNKKKSTFFKRKFSFFKERKKEKYNVNVPSYQPVFTIKKSFQSRFNEFLTLVKVDFKSSIYSIPFLLLCIVWTVMSVGAILHNLGGQDVYGNVLPTTGLLVGLILEPLSQIGLFLIVFYSGELIWKSRQFKFHEILDTTPAKNRILLFSKYTALFLLPIFIILIGILIGLLFQFANRYGQINYGLYASVFYYGGASLFIYGVLSIFIQQLVKNKYVGMLVSLISIYGLSSILPLFGIQHPLGNIFKLPNIGEGYSEFVGFGQIVNSFHWMAFLWISVSFILLLISFKVYKRNYEQRFKDQLKMMFKNWKQPQRIVLGILLVFITLSATIIDRKLKENTSFTDFSTESEFRENYEKNYIKYRNNPTPVVIGIKTYVDLFPKELSYTIKGEYTIQNNTQELIDTVLVTGRLRFTDFSIQGAKVIEEDTSCMDVKLIVFNSALKPNDKSMMKFTVHKKIGDFEVQRDIVTNGTYLRNSSFEPRFGYQKALEITSKFERKKRALIESKTEVIEKNLTRPKQDFETWITTDSDQIPIAPGKLLDIIHLKNRITYHYKSYGKTDNNISYFSSSYVLSKEKYKGISIEVYHLPQHAANVSEIIKAAKSTLDYGIQNFGAYPFDHLRIAEVPLHWRFGGHALAGTIAFQEQFFTQDMSSPTKGIDQLSRVVIHEIGHQWFGHKLSPASGKGASMLSESFANYIEAQVLEKMYGKTIVRRLGNFSRRRYFNFKSSSETKEPPLFLVKNETYISYRKGFLSMQSLKELIGEEKLNSSLKNLIDLHYKEQSATSSDFLDILLSKSTIQHQKLIKDWFQKIITYDLKITDVRVNESSNGKILLSMKIEAKRFQSSSGVENEIAIDELITLGFYQEYPDRITANPIMEKVLLDQAINEVTFTLKSKPKFIVLDPMVTRLDKDISDNIHELNSGN